MKNMSDIVKELQELAELLEYPVYPGFTANLPHYDFGRKIGSQQHDFWVQYGQFIRLMDGFQIDGIRIYGLENHGKSKYNRLIEYNDELTLISQKAPNAYVESYDHLIVIGNNGTDTFVYDVRTQKWDMRDRIAIDESYESHDTFESFLSSVVKTIQENNT